MKITHRSNTVNPLQKDFLGGNGGGLVNRYIYQQKGSYTNVFLNFVLLSISINHPYTVTVNNLFIMTHYLIIVMTNLPVQETS